MRRLARTALLGLTLATGTGTALTVVQNPLAEPYVERGLGEARLALERAMAAEVTPQWLLPRMAEALAAADRDRVDMLAGLAVKYGVPLPPETWAQIDVLRQPPGLAEQAWDCAVCAMDIHACAALSQIAACALPFEMTVAGDVNALRRQAQAALAGAEVDRLEVGLALVGVGATVAVIASGGASYVVKAGATTLRVARRMGALTPGFTRVLREAADLPVDWSAVMRGANLDEITDTAKLARLGRIAEDFGTLRANTSTAEALVLLRHVDSAEDAARLARLSAAAGRETRATIEVLGPARAFRRLVRLSDLAIAAIGFSTLFAAQAGQLALSVLGRRLRRFLLGPRTVARR